MGEVALWTARVLLGVWMVIMWCKVFAALRRRRRKNKVFHDFFSALDRHGILKHKKDRR